jgi:hypothetical protein
MLTDKNMSQTNRGQHIGYWRRSVTFVPGHNWLGSTAAEELMDLPWPEDYIDETWNAAEKAVVISYIRKQTQSAQQWRGFSACRLCGETLGTQCLTDGTYIWPEMFEHYLEAHSCKPPQVFIDHVLKQ